MPADKRSGMYQNEKERNRLRGPVSLLRRLEPDTQNNRDVWRRCFCLRVTIGSLAALKEQRCSMAIIPGPPVDNSNSFTATALRA